MANDDYTEDKNPLYQGGLNKEFVDTVYAVGGLPLLKEFLKTVGNNIALRCHPDHIAKNTLPNADPIAIDSLKKRSILLLNAKGLDDSQLEKAIKEMPAGGNADQETLNEVAEALDEIARLEGELQTTQEAHEALRGQYRKLVTEDAKGLRNMRGIEEILRETVRLLQQQGGKGGNPVAERELRDLKTKYGTIEGQYKIALEQKTSAEKRAREARSALEVEQSRYRTLEGQLTSAREQATTASRHATDAENQTKNITAALGTLQRIYDATRQECDAASTLLARLYQQNAALETRLKETGVDSLEIANITGAGTATLHELQIGKYRARLKQNQDNPLIYILLLQELFEKNHDVPKGGEAEYAKEMIYHIQRLGALDALCDLAVQYKQQGNLAAAEFMLAKPYWDGIEHPRAYETLADVVDQQNTAHDLGREAWAKKIRHDGRQIQFKKKIAHYRNIIAQDDRNILAYTGIVKTLMEKTNGNPADGERKYANFALFKIRELGAEERIIQLAKEYHNRGQSPAAEFILDKVVKDETRTAAAYTLLASVVRESSTYNQEREKWAQFLDWKAKEVRK